MRGAGEDEAGGRAGAGAGGAARWGAAGARAAVVGRAARWASTHCTQSQWA